MVDKIQHSPIPPGAYSVLASSTFAFTVCFAAWMMFAVLGIPIKAQLGLNETQFGLLTAMPVLTGSLVRVPLGWQNLDDRMFRDANPNEPAVGQVPNDLQTVEMRSPDGSAAIHLLLAAIVVAARVGLTEPGMLEYANERYVSGDASKLENLEQLPASCYESAQRLQAQRALYEAEGVFPPKLIDAWVAYLEGLGDENLREDIATARVLVEDLVETYFHIG